MRFSLRAKLLLLCFAVSLIALSSTLVFRHFMLRDFKRYAEGEAQDRIQRVASMLEGHYGKNGNWNTSRLHEDVAWALQSGLEIQVRDTSGIEIASTRNTLATLSPAMLKRINESTGYMPAKTVSPMETVPLFLAGNNIGELDARTFNPFKEQYYVSASNRFFALSVAIIGASAILLAVLAARRLATPIQELSQATREIADGLHGRRAKMTGSDETAELAADFNRMADRIEAQEHLRKKLLSGAAHELRTPLAIISGELEGMIDGVLPCTEEALKSILEEARRLKGILDGIDDLTRAEASISNLRKQTIHLKPFLSAISGKFARFFSEKGAALNLDCPDSLYLDADPDRLSQIVINLLSNSCKAVGHGGNATISASGSNSDCSISISDTGCGISPDDLPYIFERFYRGNGNGLGLGLAIVKELVNAHGGTIEAIGRSGGGTVVTLSIPRKS